MRTAIKSAVALAIAIPMIGTPLSASAMTDSAKTAKKGSVQVAKSFAAQYALALNDGLDAGTAQLSANAMIGSMFSSYPGYSVVLTYDTTGTKTAVLMQSLSRSIGPSWCVPIKTSMTAPFKSKIGKRKKAVSVSSFAPGTCKK